MTIHLVYPHEDKKTSPNVIGHTLYRELSKLYKVQVYNWDERCCIFPEKGDVLIGHPHPVAHTVLRRSAKKMGWNRKIILQPFNTDWRQISFIDEFIEDFDSFLAISGEYWFDRIDFSHARRWKSKLKRLDMAIDLHDFERYKLRFNKKNERRFIYIGSDHPGKNLDYLNEIAKRSEGVHFSWMGTGKQRSHIKSLGYMDVTSETTKKMLASYDFMITVGNADSNPTTILESIAVGLIPICTETSGYYEGEGILNISNNLDDALNTIRIVQQYDELELEKLSNLGYKRVQHKHSWNVFIKNIISEINSTKINKIEYKSKTEKIEYIYPYRYFLIRYIFNNIKYKLREIGLL